MYTSRIDCAVRDAADDVEVRGPGEHLQRRLLRRRSGLLVLTTRRSQRLPRSGAGFGRDPGECEAGSEQGRRSTVQHRQRCHELHSSEFHAVHSEAR